MKFVLVNGRTPRPHSFCVLGGEPIGMSYLREIGTRLPYCDRNCYAEYGKSTVGDVDIARENHEAPSPYKARQASAVATAGSSIGAGNAHQCDADPTDE